MWMEKNIYFTEHDIYFTKLMFILKNINLELKSALRTKYIFYRILLYSGQATWDNCAVTLQECPISQGGDKLVQEMIASGTCPPLTHQPISVQLLFCT